LVVRHQPVPRTARRGNVVVRAPRRSLPTFASERARRAAGVIAALILVFAFVRAGLSIVPHVDSDAEIRRYAIPAGADMPLPGQVLPVFVMRDVGGPIRHGTATLDPDGALRATFFTTPVAEAAQSTAALLFDPTLMAMWAVAPEGSREELRVRFVAVQDEVMQTLERVVGSDAFVNEYRPMLREILSDALETAWGDPRTREAFDRLAAITARLARYDLRASLEAIVMAQIQNAVWSFVETNWSWLATAPFGGELDYTPLAQAVQDTISDPRVRDTLSDFAQRTLALDETRQLAERVAIVAVDTLMRDPRVAEIGAAMYNDPRLRADVQPLTSSILAMLAAIPRHLGGLGNENDLNPLAAHVFKAMTLNERVGFVMFVTPERYREIRGIAPDVAVALTELPPPAVGDADGDDADGAGTDEEGGP
jgi:hypothetical protein